MVLKLDAPFTFAQDIWELPRLPVVDFYNRNDNITGQLFSAAGYSSNGSLILEPELIRETVPMGLWRASNLFVAAALELAETAEAYVAAGVDFSALASYNFVVVGAQLGHARPLLVLRHVESHMIKLLRRPL